MKRQVTENGMAHPQFLLAKEYCNHIFGICKIYSFSSTKIVAPKRLMITF